MGDIPNVELPGSGSYWSAYEWGSKVNGVFPHQGAEDFAYAVTENERGPLEGHSLIGLFMVQEGENDERSWIWLVSLDDGSHWWLEGWCDYTGWDCRSGVEWTPYEAGGDGESEVSE